MDLIRAGEAGAAPMPYHDVVLRLRADLFHFGTVSLPALPDRREPWYASMEPTCLVDRSALQADWVPCSKVRKSDKVKCAKKDKFAEVRPQQLQDLWLYGTRPAMERVLLALSHLGDGPRQAQVVGVSVDLHMTCPIIFL